MELKEYPKIGERAWYETLPNGLRIVVVPKPGFRRSKAFFAANYGGTDRRFRLDGVWTDTPAGVAHFLEHKMFDMADGSNALTVLSSRGAAANAFTSSDMTAYYFDCIGGFEENLRTLLSFVSEPYFTEESVRKEQGIIAQEIKMTEDDPDTVIYYNLMKSLFRYNPVRDSVAGTVESISEITPQVLYDCHKMFYNPSNMVLVVAGNEDPSRVVQIAYEMLPQKGLGRPVRDGGKAESNAPYRMLTECSMDVGTPMFLAGLKTASNLAGRMSAEYEYTASLALSSLMGRSTPLYNSMYTDGIINDVFSYDFEISSGVSYIMFGGESRDRDAVISRILEEADRLSQNGIDEAFFARRKKTAYGLEVSSLNSFDNICYNVANSVFMGYDYFEMPDILEAVTADNAARFLGQYFNREMAAVSVINSLRR